MKNKVIVSVIVPVYNVEKFLDKTISSLCAQDYENIEIILVDDGSTDESGKICDKWSKKDKRIKTIHQKNSKVSSARNAGILKSSGEYITFVDGDDWVDGNYVSYLLSLISDSSKTDMAVNNAFYGMSDERVAQETDGYSSSEQVMLDIYYGKTNVAVWNKIYKKSFLTENAIKFNLDIWYGEGMLFNIECLSKTKMVAVGNKKIYHQVYNTGSAMRLFNLKSNYNGLLSLDKQEEIIGHNNKRLINALEYHRRCFNMSILMGLLKTNSASEHTDVYKNCRRGLRKNIHLVLKANITPKKKLYYIFAAIFPVAAAKHSIKAENGVENEK